MTDSKSETKPVAKNEPAPAEKEPSAKELALAKFTKLAKAFPNDTPDEFVTYGYGGIKITAADYRNAFL